MKRFSVLNAAVVAVLVLIAGCATPPASDDAGQAPQTIRIVSWNIENFGVTKASSPERMRVIADVLSQFDIVAVQEISNVREQSDPGCPRTEGECPGDPKCGVIREAMEEYLNQGTPSISRIKRLLCPYKSNVTILKKEYKYRLRNRNGQKMYEVLIIAR